MFNFGEDWTVIYHYTEEGNAKKILKTRRFEKGTFFAPVFLKPQDARIRLFIGNPAHNLKTASCLAVKVSKRIIRQVCKFKPLSKPKGSRERNLYEIQCNTELVVGENCAAIRRIF
jgi:hypothetical protein